MKRLALVTLFFISACTISPVPSPTIDVAAIYTQAVQTLPAKATLPSIATEIPFNMPIPLATSLPITPIEPKADLQAEVAQALGDSNRKAQRVIGISYDQFEQGDILVEWSINDNITSDMIKFGAKNDVTRILEAVASSNFNYTSITLQGYFPLQDVYGNISENMVVSVVYNKSTVDKIYWPTFMIGNVYIIADQENVIASFQ